MEPKSTSRSRKPRARTPLAVWFILLTAGLGGLPAQGTNPTNSIEFAKSLARPGSVRWEAEHELNAERQESYRKRLSIPDAAAPFVRRAITANLINGPKTPPVHPPSEAGAIERFFDLCFFAAILLLAGGLAARKFAPELLVELNQRFNPWAVPPAGARDYPASVRSEEEPFGEFLATLRAGPAAAPRAEAPGAEVPHAEFYARVKPRLANQRRLYDQISRATNDLVRKQRLLDLGFELRGLKDEAGFPELLPVWQAASALEGLLKELGGKIKNVTPSTLRTVQGGLALLDQLCVPGPKPDLQTSRPLKFLVVDDDLISRQALAFALKKAFSEPDLAMDSFGALIHTTRQKYDVIFLDVQMPGMDGFELCQVIHDADLNRSTPVVFVTSHSDFDARAKSTLIGGNDLMGKPFLIFEVTVKALTLGLQGRLQAMDAKSAPKTGPAPGALDSPATVTDSTRFVASPVRQRRPTPATPPAELNDAARAFLNRAAKQLGPLRVLCETMLQANNEAGRQNLLADGFLRLNSLLARNGPDILHPAWQLSSALEGLFRKLLKDAALSTPTTLATIAAGVELLNALCQPGLKADLGVNPPIRLLVVDDDLVARRALAGALQTTFEKPESAESGEAALALARAERFDVVFLDLQMPGMDGFETCSKIRQSGLNQSTPVVFVTGHADSADPAATSRYGSDGLVEKPFLTSEITLKALMCALRSRLELLETGTVTRSDPQIDCAVSPLADIIR